MKFRILAVAIVLSLYPGEESSAEETLSGEDKTLWETFKGIPDPKDKDCNAVETIKSLAWLKQMTSQTDKDGKEKTENVLAKRWTDLPKLRKFLQTQKYTDEPGSVQFFNWQDKHINLDCGKLSTNWSVTVPNSEYDDYAKKFASESHAQTLSPSSSIPQVYFRIFKCNVKDCTHSIYAFNRPLPILEFPLYHVEGDKHVSFDCKIHSCIVKNVKDEHCRFPLKPQPVKQNEPFKFFWTLPETQKTAFDHLHADRMLRRNKTLPLGIKMKDITFEGNIYGSRLMIDVIDLKHEGVYECVVQDANGVVSTVDKSDKNVFDSSIPYKGVGTLHIRAIKWLYVAIGITAALLVMAFLMNYCLPSNAEFDDQALEKKDK